MVGSCYYTNTVYDLISDMYQLYDTITSDHHRLVVHVDGGNADIDVDNCIVNHDMGQNAMKIKWSDLSQESI